MRKPRFLILLHRASDADLGAPAQAGRCLSVRLRGPEVEVHFGPGSRVRLLDALVPYMVHIRDRRGTLIRLRPNAAQQQFARQRSERNIIL